MRDYRVQYRNKEGYVFVTRVAYTEEGANDRADEMEKLGNEILDILECVPGVFPKEAEGNGNV